jgi:hypothetical protein
MRFRLRTLLILMAIVPPVFAAVWFWPSWAAVVVSLVSVALAFGS